MSAEAQNFSWLLDNFVRNTSDVEDALVVSADGLLMAMSADLDRTQGDQLAAIVAGMSSLTRGAARQFGAGEVRQAMVEMDSLWMFLMSINDGSVLAATADASCDIGLIAYEMQVLIERFEAALTPQLITEMRKQLPVHGQMRAPVG